MTMRRTIRVPQNIMYPQQALHINLWKALHVDDWHALHVDVWQPLHVNLSQALHISLWRALHNNLYVSVVAKLLRVAHYLVDHKYRLERIKTV